MVSVIYFILTIVVMAKFCVVRNLKTGDACILEESGDAGVCTSLMDCKSAKMGLRPGKRPQICFYEGRVSIVCCNSTQTSFVSSVRGGTAPAELLERTRRAADSSTCPAIPLAAVKVRKTGRKAWDKCIDLADTVYPCVPSSFIYGAKKIRNHECAHTVTSLIVGGEAASPSEFPHMAAVGSGDPDFIADINWYCGGSLINEFWVLTAAHCMSASVGGSVSHVRLGGGDLSTPPTIENLFTVILPLKHPNYRRPSQYNDIGLLKLNRRVIFSMGVRPVCLHTGEAVSDEKALVTGWGANETRGAMIKLLQKTIVQKFTFEECGDTHHVQRPKLTHGVQNSTQTCYGHRTERQDTCQGDSGGPLQIYNSDRVDCTYLLIGVTSVGKACGEPDIPAIYTRVSAFVPWIEDIVWPDNN